MLLRNDLRDDLNFVDGEWSLLRESADSALPWQFHSMTTAED